MEVDMFSPSLEGRSCHRDRRVPRAVGYRSATVFASIGCPSSGPLWSN